MATTKVPLTLQKDLDDYFEQLKKIAEDSGKCFKDNDGSVTCLFKGLDQLNKQVRVRVNIFIGEKSIKALYSFTGKDDQIISAEAAIEKIAEQKNSISCEPVEPTSFD